MILIASINGESTQNARTIRAHAAATKNIGFRKKGNEYQQKTPNHLELLPSSDDSIRWLIRHYPTLSDGLSDKTNIG